MVWHFQPQIVENTISISFYHCKTLLAERRTGTKRKFEMKKKWAEIYKKNWMVGPDSSSKICQKCKINTISDVPLPGSIHRCRGTLISGFSTPATLTLTITSTSISIRVTVTVILTAESHSLKHSNLSRMLSWIKHSTLPRFHSICKIWHFI